MSKRAKSAISLLLALCMVAGFVPSMSIGARAAEPMSSTFAGKYQDVQLAPGTGVVINGGASEAIKSDPHSVVGSETVRGGEDYNMLMGFGVRNGDGYITKPIDGFTVRGNAYVNYGTAGGEDNYLDETFLYDGRATATVRVDGNPVLRDLAKGGNLEFRFDGTAMGAWDENIGEDDYDWIQVWVRLNGENLFSGMGNGDGTYINSDGDNPKDVDTGWVKLNPGDVITIVVNTGGDAAGVDPGLGDAGLYFRDLVSPTASYDYSTNATVNSQNGDELLLKLGTKNEADPDKRYAPTSITPDVQEYVDLNFNITEPVKLENAPKVNTSSDPNVTSAKSAYDAALADYTTAQSAAAAAQAQLSAAEAKKQTAQDVETAVRGAVPAAIAVETAYQNAYNSAYQTEIGKLPDPASPTSAEADAARAAGEAAGRAAANTTVQGYQHALSSAESAATAAGATTDDKTAYMAAYCNYYAANGAYSVVAVPSAANGVRGLLGQLSSYYGSDAKKVAAIGELSSAVSGAADAAAATNAIAIYIANLTSQISSLEAAYNTADAYATGKEGAVGTTLTAYENAVAVAEVNILGSGGMDVQPEIKAILTHELFTNTLGTGYMGSGQNRGLELYKCTDVSGTAHVTQARSYAGGSVVGTSAGLTTGYMRSFSYRYSARRGDFNGNNAVASGGAIESLGAYRFNDANGCDPSTLLTKLNNAGFHDAAGNPLIISPSNGRNPFDLSDGGYNVIIDAEPPTYTRVGNGITPEVLTGLVLNHNDKVDFTVAFSEAVITKRGFDNAKTYLLLNNDDRAAFVTKTADGKQWTFRHAITDAAAGETETPLWKAIALTNEALDSSYRPTTGYDYAENVDGRCITDYVGNILADRANVDNVKEVNSSTAWAELAVDNTAPYFDFTYQRYSESLTAPASDATWGQAGRIVVNASDPAITMPSHDPLEPAAVKVSKGIYRPQNMTGGSAEQSPAAGLFFYTWTKSEIAPDVGENYEAIKRYSLSGEQPSTVTDKAYAAAWTDYTLLLANNTASIVPPDKAINGASDGVWYLHVWTSDMTWDSARQLMQYKLMSGLKYNAGYDQAKYNSTRQTAIDDYRTANTVDTGRLDSEGLPVYETPTYDEAWAQESVRNAVFTAAYTPAFLAWLAASGKDIYSDDAMSYANTEAMKVVGAYGETSASVGGVVTPTWTLDQYAQNDSNWTYDRSRILFDNGKPAAELRQADVVGSDTAMVNARFTVTDALSGVNGSEISYQWVKKTETAPTEASWDEMAAVSVTGTAAAPEGLMTGAPTVSAEATTLGSVIEDGEYYLLVRAADDAGNVSITVSDFTVLVNSKRSALCAFGAKDLAAVPTDYVQSVIPTARVTGVEIREVSYALSSSIATPQESAFSKVVSADASTNDKTYILPEMKAPLTDGTWYVHVKVVEDTADPAAKPYYFRQAYSLDNTAPAAYFSAGGSALAKESYTVTVTVHDGLSGVAAPAAPEDGADAVYPTAYYQWVLTESAAQPAPAADDPAWKSLPDGGEVTLAFGENGAYKLYCKVADKAGNVTVSATAGTFLLEAAQKEEIPAYASELLNVYEKDGKVYGVARLDLDAADQSGYRCSVSLDGGKTWCNWLPYMSMIRLELPVESLDLNAIRALDLRVSFRAPRGTVATDETGALAGSPIATASATMESGVFATAEFDSMAARRDGVPLAILTEKPDDVTVTPAGQNPAAAAADGSFTVTQNGVYTFDLTKDGADPETLTVVVDLYDNTAPLGSVSYSTMLPTNSSVTATLETNEPVRVTSEGGKNHVFSDNGAFTFTFEDAAGNTASVIASVGNIDRTPPSVKITSSYTYGAQGENAFGTLGGMAQGVLLTVEKLTPTDKDFTVVSGGGEKSMVVTENGTYSFTVADRMGNTTTVSKTVGNIVSKLPAHTVTYEFVDESGAPVTPTATIGGVPYAKANVKVTIRIPAASVQGAGNAVYCGTQKIEKTVPQPKTELDPATGKDKYVLDAAGEMVYVDVPVTNLLPMDGGDYVYTRTYTANGDAAVALCDGLGNVERIPVTVKGIDKKAPVVTLAKPVVSLSAGTELTQENFREKLGGLTVSDNVSEAANVTVTLEDLPDVTLVGRKTVTYLATDEMGNQSRTEQTVFILPADGLLVLADGTLLSGASSESSILPDNRVTFTVDPTRMQQMGFRDYGVKDSSKTAQNEAMRYDIYYVTGLYREGQLKYIASRLTSEELAQRNFEITFEKPGWYTIIIRNQERTREYTTFFISSIESD